MKSPNRQYRLAARPAGMVGRSDFDFCEEDVRALADGEVLVKVLYVSLDPAMRGWMNDSKSYIAPVAIGEVMRAGGAGRVIESRNAKFAPGDHVVGMFGVQEYAIGDGTRMHRVDPFLAPLARYLGALGMPGMTAYFGLLDVGKPVPGNTVVVSAAAGAVGSIVGQIAKIKGCRAIGIAGVPPSAPT
jgi:NADPH-dependent curcumin reductase CurA